MSLFIVDSASEKPGVLYGFKNEDDRYGDSVAFNPDTRQAAGSSGNPDKVQTESRQHVKESHRPDVVTGSTTIAGGDQTTTRVQSI
jgi:hypothetical protein